MAQSVITRMLVWIVSPESALGVSTPASPSISPFVSLWKGVAKPLAMAALGAAAIGSLFHYITKGPNEVSKELEDEMEARDRAALAEDGPEENAP